jgi:hypothetical protein
MKFVIMQLISTIRVKDHNLDTVHRDCVHVVVLCWIIDFLLMFNAFTLCICGCSILYDSFFLLLFNDFTSCVPCNKITLMARLGPGLCHGIDLPYYCLIDALLCIVGCSYKILKSVI